VLLIALHSFGTNSPGLFGQTLHDGRMLGGNVRRFA
jgi:hypothetical protein